MQEEITAVTSAVAEGSSVITDFFARLGLAGISSTLSAVIIFLICALIITVVMRVLDRAFAKSKRADPMVKRFLRTAIKVVLWALSIVIIAGVLGIPTGSLVAVVSVAGLALSLAMQNILSNLFSGVTLLFAHPISAGEYVEIGAHAGTVHSVGLFYTVIITPNRQVVTIPNSDVASASITNYSREPLRRAQFVYAADYDDPTEDVKAALLDAAGSIDKIAADPAPGVFLSAYKDSVIEYTVNVWCRNADYWDVVAAMNETVRERFDARGVHMSFNHLNVHMMKD